MSIFEVTVNIREWDKKITIPGFTKTTAVSALKATIGEHINDHNSEIILTYRQIILEDSKTLEFYGIDQPRTIITKVIEVRNIFVQSSSGLVISCAIKQGWKGSDLIGFVRGKMGVRDSLNLMWNGEAIKPEDDLFTLGIQDRDPILAIVLLKGGN